VRIIADNSQASYILTKPLHSSQRLIEKNRTDGSMTFELDVVINPELITQLLGFGAGIRVTAPESLTATLRDIYRRGCALYDR
ncbi:MAG: WYL domain-containing protein, partial [Duncaniella sp.]|nr:WYL domain-containing protein [Duncaniella sp.]